MKGLIRVSYVRPCGENGEGQDRQESLYRRVLLVVQRVGHGRDDLIP